MPPVREIASAPDPVAAVLNAHEHGELISLPTSGTTSRPRSVVRTTASWVDSFAHVSRLTEIDGCSRVWVPGPLAATMNLFAAVHARMVGAILVDTPEEATHAHLTPATLLTALGGGADLRGVHVVVAGDRLSRDTAARARASGARTSHYYGAAELSFVAWGTHEEDLQPFPGVEIEIRTDTIWVRSPYLSLGYDRSLEYDHGADGPFAVDDAGFATVGDRGSLEQGLLTVAGRGTAMVLTGGVTVLVADVEQALRRATGSDVVIVGVPHRRLGQVVGAVVTEPAAAARIRSVARAELASAQQPRLWFAVPSFPVTPSGKVDRIALSAMAANGQLTAVTSSSRSKS
ncbi:AMP-binding protein [Blastococcus mobilis]|uniref:Acyl-CoA synthetase (AMP-forming)/AMP-acid ligase II n=1 Tax=Blastococcus mobilis TaxID=1938746 RepID=A0A238ZVI1_9ACTN|nr:AMP-binding protein [Blastococcus mobilis]SNR87229.1 Acyl-CoA synthetase (AMP-forming)/AMP-acid ligase II [Blastococcus mobilis]